ncbi:hypothetical protein JCM14202_175 [Agrilactobacillus composti DSM 18527 = JCM 14202]|uniref:hypothetical protein n=1 Tax=Agrilactobacillus composti TaxID=398555 RepID=UPI00042DE2CF|nr:hypothetical protein [Agrilactobacillus composti]GAF38371.1 hypothetical protein JCM14202_175 [Agrilactobacillus composti DSM 18527 = JCM 14202]
MAARLIALVFIIYTWALFFKLSSIPGLFIDESAYANEVKSLANFGVDTHGYLRPVYFQGPYGGQSVLYSWLSVPVVKLWGFSLLTFRAHFALLNLLMLIGITLLVSHLAKNLMLGLCMTLALTANAWLFIPARWILDCNIAPIIFLGALCVLTLGLKRQLGTTGRILLLETACGLLALTLYGYIVAWLYIPLVVLILGGYLHHRQLLSLQEIIIGCLLIGLLALPLMVFAVHVNVLHSPIAHQFLWWTLPPLPNNRLDSLIDLQPTAVFQTMTTNAATGVIQYVTGNDGLPWNSLPMPSVLPILTLSLAIGGMVAPLNGQNVILSQFRNLLNISLIAFSPLLLIVRPNFNHWNFLNWPLAILAGLGLWALYQWLNPAFFKALLLVAPLIAAISLWHSYFSPTSGNYFTQGLPDNPITLTTTSVYPLHQLLLSHPQQRLYLANLPSVYPHFKLLKTVSPDQDGRLSDTGVGMPPRWRYGQLVDASQAKVMRLGDFLLISKKACVPRKQGAAVTVKTLPVFKFKQVKTLYFQASPHVLLQRIQ